MIRSSRLSLSSLNVNKASRYDAFLAEFRRIFTMVVDEMWNWPTVPRLVSHKSFSHVETWLSARAMQVVTKQASALVRGTRTSAKRLRKTPSKPVCNDVCPELDSRFINVNFGDKTSFDAWLTLSSFSKIRGTKILVPLKSTSHFNKWKSRGTMTNGCRLSKKGITFMFDVDPLQNNGNQVLGIDVGIADVITASDGQHGNPHPHDWSLSQIQQRLARRKKGSHGFRRAQDLRINFINWSLNQLNLTNVSTLVIENIKHLRHGRPCDRFRSHWTYTQIFRKLNMLAEEHGVRVIKVNPAYTSQTCSSCGAVDRDSRSGKHFRCIHCGFECDADLNAAINISLVGEAHIVPRVDENSGQCNENTC